MEYIKLFEELWHSPKFDVKYYWRVTINRIIDLFKECDIERVDDEDTIILNIRLGHKSCEVKFDHSDCFLNGDKSNPRESLFSDIKDFLGIDEFKGESYKILESSGNSELLRDYFDPLIDSGLVDDIEIKSENLQPDLRPYLIIYHNVYIYWHKDVDYKVKKQEVSEIIKRIKSSDDFVFNSMDNIASFAHSTKIVFSEHDKIEKKSKKYT